MWQDLTQREKFDLIRDYIRQGYNDLDDIMSAYNADVVNKYGYGGPKGFIDLARQRGHKIRITSGYRPGARTKSGHASNHSKKVAGGSGAYDFAFQDGNFEEGLAAIYNDPVLVDYLYKNGLGLLEETSSSVMGKTGAMGKHIHLGPDTWARQMRDNRVKMYGTRHSMSDVTWQDVQAHRQATSGNTVTPMSDEDNAAYFNQLLDNTQIDFGEPSVQKKTDPFSFMDTENAAQGMEMLQAYNNIMNTDFSANSTQQQAPQTDGYMIYLG